MKNSVKLTGDCGYRVQKFRGEIIGVFWWKSFRLPKCFNWKSYFGGIYSLIFWMGVHCALPLPCKIPPMGEMLQFFRYLKISVTRHDQISSWVRKEKCYEKRSLNRFTLYALFMSVARCLQVKLDNREIFGSIFF